VKTRPQTFGFKRTATLLEKRVRDASAQRGFAVSRLLTHWNEVVGEDLSKVSRPVEVTYGRGGLGATLTILTTASQAPMLQMQIPVIQDRVNACYGYKAIEKVRITQTARTGFAEGQAMFTPAAADQNGPTPGTTRRAAQTTADVVDADLRAALTSLGASVLSKTT